MKKTVLTFGLISGAVAAVLMTITASVARNSNNFDDGVIYGYAGIILSLLLVFFGIRSYRDNIGGGAITFGKAFSVGILIALISSICYVIAWIPVSHFLLPDFVEQYTQAQMQKLNEAGLSAQEMAAEQDKLMKMNEMMKNPVTSSLLVFIEPFPVGIIMTLISALILRRKPKEKAVHL